MKRERFFLEPFNKGQAQLFVIPKEKVESPDLSLIQKNSLLTVVPPVIITPQVLGQIIGEPEKERREIVEYIVQPGETLSSIAESFDISLNTLLWANNLNKNSILRPGQKLVIPPVSGVIHQVKEGDTLSQIAENYQANLKEILAFNDLSSENDIFIGDILIIPGGILPSPVKSSPTPEVVPLVESQFIPPLLPPYIVTQGLHWFNAVDLSYPGHACGRPVLAAAGGIVQKTGYDRIAGNYVRILHPNGLVTFYGHLSGITVKSGTQVNVGETIGYIGNTGYTQGLTGCHVHFEVRGGRNPFAVELEQ